MIMENKQFDKKEMYLESPSGFMMPFASDEEVLVSLEYGEVSHPSTGQPFHHSGTDYVCPHKPLFACASGTVVGVGRDDVHDQFIKIRYGRFEVKYGHIQDVLVSYGSPVSAGQQVAVSGDFLHFGVLFNGQEINPDEFIAILYGNISLLFSMGMDNYVPLVDFGVDVKTKYDTDKDEIISMMLRYLPEYFDSLSRGTYTPGTAVETNLRNLFAQGAQKNLFFENIPQVSNPLGLGPAASPLVSQVQEQLIGDFLNYVAVRHGQHVTTWTDEQKKKLLMNFAPRK